MSGQLHSDDLHWILDECPDNMSDDEIIRMMMHHDGVEEGEMSDDEIIEGYEKYSKRLDKGKLKGKEECIFSYYIEQYKKIINIRKKALNEKIKMRKEEEEINMRKKAEKEEEEEIKMRKTAEKEDDDEEKMRKKAEKMIKKSVTEMKKTTQKKKESVHKECSDMKFRKAGELCNELYPNGPKMKQFYDIINKMFDEDENIWNTKLKGKDYDKSASIRTWLHEHSPSSCQFWYKGGKLYETGVNSKPCFVNKALAQANSDNDWNIVHGKGTGRRGGVWMYVEDLDIRNWDEEKYGPLPNIDELKAKEDRRNYHKNENGRETRNQVKDLGEAPYRLVGFQRGGGGEFLE